MKLTNCRMCKSNKITKFLDLGKTALADNFLTKNQLEEKEEEYPLNVYCCDECGLWQLGYVVSPELMFNQNYPYDSSTTQTGKDHYTKMGISISERFHLKPKSLAIDVGSNVGVLLSGFKSKGLEVLGIEPSSNVADIAKKNGINTMVEFFSSKLAEEIQKKYGKASVITGTNVFAHINDLDDFIVAADHLLTEDGIIIIEAPYLLNLIENLEYDTIYHEHLSYLSLKPMVKFFKKFGMEVFDVEMQKIHGGTLRYFIGRTGKRSISKNVEDYLSLENKKRIHSIDRLEEFSTSVQEHHKKLKSLLTSLKKDGKKIVGVSAPAKGNTLLNYCKIGPELLDYVTERNPLKIGKFTPGMHIPVLSDEILLEEKPDYALLLAWNFADEIIKNNQKFRNIGGKFIIPIPTPKII